MDRHVSGLPNGEHVRDRHRKPVALDDTRVLGDAYQEHIAPTLHAGPLDGCTQQAVELDEEITCEDLRPEQAVPDDQRVAAPVVVADHVVEHCPLAQVPVDQRPAP